MCEAGASGSFILGATGRSLSRIDEIAADDGRRDICRHYDELGRLTRAVGPPVSSGDPTRPVLCYVYSVLGDVTEVWAGGTTDTTSAQCTLDGTVVKRQWSAVYDDFGRLWSRTDALGNVWRWSWNRHDQMTTSQTPAQAAAGESTSYTYGVKGIPGDTQGLLKSRSTPDPAGQNVAYFRDILGNVLVARTVTATLLPVVTYTYAYDNTGRLASLIAPNGESVAFRWDDGGRLLERRLGSGLTTRQTWHEDGNLKTLTQQSGAGAQASFNFSLDAQGRRTGLVETIGGNTRTWAYTHDNLERLTSANDATAAETYAYDIWGNRTRRTTAAQDAHSLYDAAHRLTEIRANSPTGTLMAAAVHDADGRMTKLCEAGAGGSVTVGATDCSASGPAASTLALAWNALDLLQGATRTGASAIAETYTYDHQGRRLRKTGPAARNYAYAGDDIYAEWTAPGGPASAVYAHGAGVDEPILRLTGATATPDAVQAAYLQDGLGSVIGTTNAAGSLTASQRFDAWGNATALTGSVPVYGYTGREPDATGLTFYRARYYHPTLGRFLRRDAAGMVDAVSPYAYVGNDPLNRVDPFGLSAKGTSKGPSVATAGSYSVEISSPLSVAGALFGSQTALGNVAEADDEAGDRMMLAVNVKPGPCHGGMFSICEGGGGGGGLGGAAFRARAVPPPNKAPDYIVTPKGQAIPVPSGASGPTPTRAPGMQYTGGTGDAAKGLDARVTGVRVMDANANQGPRAVYMNKSGQTVDPKTGRTVPNSDPRAHNYLEPWK